MTSENLSVFTDLVLKKKLLRFWKNPEFLGTRLQTIILKLNIPTFLHLLFLAGSQILHDLHWDPRNTILTPKFYHKWQPSKFYYLWYQKIHTFSLAGSLSILSESPQVNGRCANQSSGSQPWKIPTVSGAKAGHSSAICSIKYASRCLGTSNHALWTGSAPVTHSLTFWQVLWFTVISIGFTWNDRKFPSAFATWEGKKGVLEGSWWPVMCL